MSDDLRQAHSAFLQRLDAVLMDTAGKVAAEAEGKSKALAPVRTGRLRTSIHSTVERKGPTITVTVSTDVPYAQHVEFGTERMDAQPFMRPVIQWLASRAAAIAALLRR